ncbi:MAG: signal peptidase I [archaeon]
MGVDGKKILKKVWYFIWEDNSVWSWIVNIILAFVIIKFLVYPGLGIVLGTSHPVVAVVSGSMEHPGGTENWWYRPAICAYNVPCQQIDFYRERNISQGQFESFRFKNGFNTGDIMMLFGTKKEKIDIGDVIVFRSGKPDPIIHRVIDRWEDDGTIYFQTKGDNNRELIRSDQLDEMRIGEDAYIGEAMIRVPYLGWIKIWAVRLVASLR